MDKNDISEEILADLDIENLDETIEAIEESREEETFRNWVNIISFNI